MEPDLASLRAAVAEFGGFDQPERSWAVLTAATGSSIDLGVPAHRDAVHVWLNAWGCRIRTPRPGEPRVLDTGLEAWWAEWRDGLPDPAARLARLTDEEVERLGECFAALSATAAARHGRGTRTLGPTAASKLLFALRPNSLPPWDNLIAQRLHGARDGVAYRAHLRVTRGWAVRLLAEAGVPEPELLDALGRPGRSLAKVIDEYCYLVFTRGWTAPRARVTADDVRRIASVLPRTEERVVRDQVRFRVGRLVYLALSPDEETMGFAFPKEEREALIASAPHRFHAPTRSDMRFNWVCATLSELTVDELEELVVDAWRMCVPESVARSLS
ncbi:MmcQ/YjbR family DNA-binding protein [Saccharothrix longispora]|uniref:MmcQ/YjbR family DNA-binding protein n=1 Tax=Saccharothrix longispora TaxID=33920 RepID=UPI0028FD00F7|nr:MmcQ/YjbR family DNA-binding protein [Saccharothrix longispora]MDU0292339.1 MmcQ/YjbR family DNA-binding protein [Saccharothrix longispora]